MFFSACFSTAQENSEASIRASIDFLTSDVLAGRDAPGSGAKAAAVWIADAFQEVRLAAPYPARVPKTGFFQTVPLIASSLDTVATKLTLYSGDRSLETSWGDGIYYFPKRIGGGFDSLETVYCGYGLEIPEQGRFDYTEAVKGKAAVVLAGSDAAGESVAMRSQAAFKAAAAERAGAAMLVILYPNLGTRPLETSLKEKIGAARNPLIDLDLVHREFPIIYCDAFSLMKELTPGSEPRDSAWLRNAVPELTGWLKGEDSGLRALRFEYGFGRRANESALNVVGMSRGKTDEWVIVGAHYDHLGTGYPGADDNASGVAGLVELARRWYLKPEAGRGVIFVAFTCEEDGLLGSEWFQKQMPVSAAKVVAMVNLDMIGREGFGSMRDAMNPKATPVGGFAAAYFSAASPPMRDLIRAAADGIDLYVEIRPVNNFRHFGDAAPFHNAGLPTVHIFSGFHSDYHAKSDTPDKIDYIKLGRMIDLTEKLVTGLCQTNTRPTFDPTIRVEGAAPY
jgi:hypothetical protein